MEQIQPLIDYAKNHWIDLLAIIGAVDVILGIITRLTPFTWDDNVYTLLHKAIAGLIKK